MMYLYKRITNANLGMSFLFNVSDVLNYPREGSRKFIEGENIVNSYHLMYFSIAYESDKYISLKEFISADKEWLLCVVFLLNNRNNYSILI